MAFVGEGTGHGEDPRVVVPEAEPGREDLRVDVVELHTDRAAELPDRDLSV